MNKRLTSIALAVFVCLALTLGMAPGVLAATVGMVIVPTPKTVEVGHDFTVDIKVTNSGGAEVNSAGAHLDFNTTYLEVVSITPGAALNNTLHSGYNNTAGTIDYEAGVPLTIPPSPPVTTDFVLATVQFHAKAVTAGTALTFIFAPVLRQTVVYVGPDNVLDPADVTDGSVTITAAVPTVAFSAATYSVGEGAGSAIITVHLSAASTDTVTVHYSTSAGTATAGSDYTTASGTLTFNPDQTSRTFSVPILEDTSVEASETVNLALSSPTGATLGTPSMAVLTIVDNDVAPVGGTAYPPNKLLMLAPWIALGAAVIVGISLLVRRRRSAVR